MVGSCGCGGVVRAVPAKALDVAGGVVVVLEAACRGEQGVAALYLGNLHAPRPHCRGVSRPDGGGQLVARVRRGEVHVLTTQCPAHHGWVWPAWVGDDQVVIDTVSYGAGCRRGSGQDKGLKVDPQLADVRGRWADGVGAAGRRRGGALNKERSFLQKGDFLPGRGRCCWCSMTPRRSLRRHSKLRSQMRMTHWKYQTQTGDCRR